MRLIDADALKEFTYINKGNFNTVEGIRDWIDNAPTVEPEVYMTAKDYNLYLEGYKQGRKDFERPQGEWVPVSERLPSRKEYIKNNGLFNVSDGNRSYTEWFDIYDKQGFGEPTITGFRVDYAVIAWQPLPEPYKKGGAEE